MTEISDGEAFTAHHSASVVCLSKSDSGQVLGEAYIGQCNRCPYIMDADTAGESNRTYSLGVFDSLHKT